MRWATSWPGAYTPKTPQAWPIEASFTASSTPSSSHTHRGQPRPRPSSSAQSPNSTNIPGSTPTYVRELRDARGSSGLAQEDWGTSAPRAAGRASRQAWVASARVDGEGTLRRRGGRRRRCRGAGRGRRRRGRARPGRRPTRGRRRRPRATSTRRTTRARERARWRARRRSRTPRRWPSRRARPRARRRTRRARRAPHAPRTSVAHEVVQRAPRRRGRRRAAPRRGGRATVAHSEPPSSASVWPSSTMASPSWSSGAGGTDVRSSISPTTPTTGVGSMSTTARLVVEAHVAADDGDAERAARVGSCRRRPRRTATSPRGARGCRS